MDKRTINNPGGRGNGCSAWQGRGQGRGRGRNSGGHDSGNSGVGRNYYYQQRQGRGVGVGSGRGRSGTHHRGGYQNRPPSSSPVQGGGPRYSMTNQEPNLSTGSGYGGRGGGAWTGRRWAASQTRTQRIARESSPGHLLTVSCTIFIFFIFWNIDIRIDIRNIIVNICASFDQRFYKLHPDLEKVMSFVCGAAAPKAI